MRFATLVALAIVVSGTPGLAAPAPFAPHRANSTHLAHSGHAVNGTAANSTHPAHHNHHHAHHGHAANATVANSTQAPKRAVTSDIVQAIEAAFDSLPLARKRDVITTALQELESLGISNSGSTVDKRFKLPKISPSTESALNNAANVATIGGGIAKIWDALGGSSSSSKRDDENISKLWSGLGDIDGSFNNHVLEREFVEADERALKIPADVTTWLKSLGNVASIGAGGAAIVGAVDGSNSTLKREFVEADERALKIPASVTTWLKNLGNVASIGAGGAAIVGAVDGGNSALKREFIEADERALKIPAGVTTWLKSLGNVASIGAGGAAIVGAVDGGSDSTLKRELGQGSNGVDLATLLDGVTTQFEDRSVSSSKASGLESILGKAATAASVGGTLATVWSALGGSSGSTKRELATDIPDSLSSHGLPRLVVPTESSWVPGPIAISKRSDSTDAESILQQITAVLEGATGGSGSARRSTGLNDITPEQLQQIVAQLNAGMADLD